MSADRVQKKSSASAGAKVASVPLLDMGRQHEPLNKALLAAIQRVCDSGRFILGPDCEELEQNIASYCQTKFAVSCASGSDALLLALMAIGIGAGDEVLLPSYTFFATASAVWRLGAKPVFIDIQPDTLNIDPQCLAAQITPATKAILPVHLYGQCADMRTIHEIAQRHKLAVIEDAAQAIGAEFEGRRAGSLGDVGCISFYPTKNLGGMGDGGMLTTDHADLAEKLRLLRAHGMQPRYYHQAVGINSRLDTLQAAVLNVKLPHLERWTQLRQDHAQRYGELFTAQGLDNVLKLPVAAANRRHVWNQYVVRVPDGKRDALREHLASAHVASEIYYPVPLHLQECFRSLGYGPGSLPESEQAAAETLALPIFPELTAAQQQTVATQIAAFFGARAALTAPKFLKRGSVSSKGVAG